MNSDPTRRDGAWTDDEVAQIAGRIKRFGWPYRQYAEQVVRVLLKEVERLRPRLDREDVAVLRESLWHSVQRGDVPDDERRRMHVLRDRLAPNSASRDESDEQAADRA